MRSILKGLTIICLLIAIACKPTTRSERELIETPKPEVLEYSYHVAVLDSMVLEDVLSVAFAFQGKSGDNLVFRDKGSAKVFVFDASGKPLYSWEKSGDVPGNFSMIADNLVYDQKGNIVLSDNMAGVRVFSPDGNLILQNRTFQPQTGFHLMVDLFRKNQVIFKEGKEFLIHHLDLMDNIQEVSEAFYMNRKNLLLTDLSNGRTKQILPFPEESKFLSGKAFPFEDFRPVFYFDQQKEILYLMFQNEAVLYAFDWSGVDLVLKDRITMDLPGFSGHEGWEYEEVNYGLLNAGQIGSSFPSRIRSLEKIGDDFLISYNPSPGNKSDLAKVQNKEASKELMDKLRHDTKIRTAIYGINTRKIGLLETHEMRYESYRLIDGEIWWMKPASTATEDENYVVYRGKIEGIH